MLKPASAESEKAILVGLALTAAEKAEVEESLEELAGLARAAGAAVLDRVYQVRPRPNPRFLIGQGKVEEVVRRKGELGADLVIFDRGLSPGQQKSLEDRLKVKVIDRTQLILDIFAQRARSNEGKLQVELAQLSYRLPRLVGKGKALSQLGAGIGTRGPGEKKLEVDRRRITDRIARIKKEIQRVQERRDRQRSTRRGSPIPVASLVGYTNAGKSTLFNRLSREHALASPQLFATLDPVLRRVSYPDGAYFFLSDTVGFIKKLPVELVSAFRGTLEEIREADIILHVVDAASPFADSQEESVDAVLEDLDVRDVPILKVFNKIDLCPDRAERLALNPSAGPRAVSVSARTGEGIGDLKAKIRALLFGHLKIFYLRIPKAEADRAASLAKWTLVLSRRSRQDATDLKVLADPRAMLDFMPYLLREEPTW
ncbi:MAG: GTPase HflX [Candidatus Aminicenantes bacterium]|nr:GTPase HflX [Candidatus Aminicenantes bacterium]